MAVGIEEIDRLEDAVVHRADHLEPAVLGPRLGREQARHVGDLEGDVLHPARRAVVAAHLRRIGQLEESKHVAAAGIEEDVHVGVGLAGRRHAVLGDGEHEVHAEHVAVELDRLARVAAAVGDMMDAAQHRRLAGRAHGLAALSTWRRI